MSVAGRYSSYGALKTSMSPKNVEGQVARLFGVEKIAAGRKVPESMLEPCPDMLHLLVMPQQQQESMNMIRTTVSWDITLVDRSL
jgi:hypothetical protein